ncbi:uncharacterized protein LOC126683055 isoform X3 [Mercurialis annua]|uniref:uncharacterized protein LOC126683055 isoform X3 n=1 Tax=Mercurialis annua TaxID=3986 RepID=UPI00215F4FD9|nr:uncharacterized protein LOC126683055 isoform X3 [Mercurialis annua]
MIVYALLFNFLYYVEISEVPSFGIMLLELITGRFAVDITQCSQLVDWLTYTIQCGLDLELVRVYLQVQGTICNSRIIHINNKGRNILLDHSCVVKV